MKGFIFRNYTVESLFGNEYAFSGYGDVSVPNGEFKDIIVFYQINPSVTPEEQMNEVEDVKSKLSFVLTNINTRRIIIINLLEDRTKNWQLKNPELLNAIKGYNHFLEEIAKDDSRVKVLDINSFYQTVQIQYVDWKFYFSSQMILNPKLAKPFKKWFEAQMNALDLKRKKCIVLDCDNTLWGGVVGEDGTHGIKLGMDYPGICYLNFQKHLEMLSRKGIILTVCSKNNLDDVKDVWENNPNQIITDKVLSAYRVNWQDKASNIRSIAEELNIGLDSFVFIDDNPVERGLVKEFLPEVETPDFPEKPYELIDFFWNVYHEYFETFELSSEDLKKTEQYKENFFRNESKKVFENMDDYLESLDMQIDIMSANDSNLLRIAQMTQKTNQFNLTTHRYTEGDLRGLIGEGASVYCANVKDKFGDNGITIACIVKNHNESIELDSYLLSCRILGRDIEKAVLLTILDKLRSNSGKAIKARFIPTKKNAMASDFLDKVGFKLENIDGDGVKYYVLSEDEKISIKEYYKIKYS